MGWGKKSNIPAFDFNNPLHREISEISIKAHENSPSRKDSDTVNSLANKILEEAKFHLKLKE
jgi:hypothetical protein